MSETAGVVVSQYNERYYQHSCGAPYGRDSAHFQKFFSGIATAIVAALEPTTVLDAGCAMGMLVEALRDRGVQSWGLDVSEHAIGLVREDLRQYCWVGSITEDLTRDYDLITCIEVLEHLPPEQATMGRR